MDYRNAPKEGLSYPSPVSIPCDGFTVQVFVDPHKGKLHHRILKDDKWTAWQESLLQKVEEKA